LPSSGQRVRWQLILQRPQQLVIQVQQQGIKNLHGVLLEDVWAKLRTGVCTCPLYLKLTATSCKPEDFVIRC